MKIYEIDAAIEQLIAESVDEETGEITVDPEKLEALQMERDTAVENLALYFKNLLTEAEAIKAEEENLKKRRQATLKAAERAESYLDYVLKGEKFKTARVAVSYRKSQKLELSDGFVSWAQVNAPDYLKYKEPEADKRSITAALKGGMEIPGAVLVENQTMQIK